MRKFFYLALCIAGSAATGHAQDRVLTIDQVIKMVRNRNPELKALTREIEAREGALLQSSLRLNPEIAIESEGGGETERAVLLHQTIRTAGKRRKGREVAALRRDYARLNYDVVGLQVIQAVKSAFVDVLASQRNIALLKLQVVSAKEFLTAAEKKVEAGGISPAEVARARVFLVSSRLELLQEEQLSKSSLQALASYWGGNRDDYEVVIGSLDTLLVSIDSAALEPYVARAPSVLLAGSAIEIREAMLAVEMAMKTPDISIGGGLKQIDQSGIYPALNLSVPLPLFNRNQGAISEAVARQRQALDEKEIVELRVSTEAHRLTVRLQSAYETAVTIRDQIIPDAQFAYKTIREGYLLGKFSYLEVVDAQNIQFESQAALIATLSEYKKAGAEVEGLLGISIQSIIKNSTEGQ